MGKKIRRSIVKVATLGAAGSGGWGQQALGALSGGLLGGGQSAMLKQAQDQQNAIAQQQAVIAQNAAALQANSTTDNVANVVAGGTADLSANADMTDLRKRKGQRLSATLGV